MKLYEVKDIIRSQVGTDKLQEPVLDWCIKRALREIEKRDNFYWMEADSKFNIYEDQQEYIIADKDGCNASDLKDVDMLLVSDRTASDPEWVPVQGPVETSKIKTSFTEGNTGIPAFWSIDGEDTDAILKLWPVLPDQAYLGHLFYWRWTSLPEAATSSAHEVLRRWPEALIYLGTEQGILVSTKDTEQAAYWHTLFDNPNPSANSEYKRIKVYQQERKNEKRFRNEATNSGATNVDQYNTARKVWF